MELENYSILMNFLYENNFTSSLIVGMNMEKPNNKHLLISSLIYDYELNNILINKEVIKNVLDFCNEAKIPMNLYIVRLLINIYAEGNLEKYKETFFIIESNEQGKER